MAGIAIGGEGPLNVKRTLGSLVPHPAEIGKIAGAHLGIAAPRTHLAGGGIASIPNNMFQPIDASGIGVPNADVNIVGSSSLQAGSGPGVAKANSTPAAQSSPMGEISQAAGSANSLSTLGNNAYSGISNLWGGSTMTAGDASAYNAANGLTSGSADFASAGDTIGGLSDMFSSGATGAGAADAMGAGASAADAMGAGAGAGAADAAAAGAGTAASSGGIGDMLATAGEAIAAGVCSVIFTGLYKQGLVPRSIWVAAQRYGLCYCRDHAGLRLFAAYLFWATPIANLITRHRWFAELVAPIFIPSLHEEAIRMGLDVKRSWYGRISFAAFYGLTWIVSRTITANKYKSILHTT